MKYQSEEATSAAVEDYFKSDQSIQDLMLVCLKRIIYSLIQPAL